MEGRRWGGSGEGLWEVEGGHACKRKGATRLHAVLGADLAVVLEDDLVAVGRMDEDVADIERVVEPRRLRAEALPLQPEWEARVAAVDLAEGDGVDVARRLGLEDHGQLAVAPGEDLALRRLDREDVVREGERVELDRPPPLPRERRAEPAVEREVRQRDHLRLRLGRRRLELAPREGDADVGAVVQPDRRLRHQRNVASVQGEERALEGDVDLRRRARQPRVARLAAVVLDEHLLVELADRRRLERKVELHRGGRVASE